jgi:hypothetical protein
MIRRVALVRTDVSEEPGASFIWVTRIGELGTTQAATSNRRTLRRNILLCVARECLIEPLSFIAEVECFLLRVHISPMQMVLGRDGRVQTYAKKTGHLFQNDGRDAKIMSV